MDGFDTSSAPAEYQDIAWMAHGLIFGMGIGWVINYVGMVYKSFQDRTYGMAIMPLCSNIAWEVVYGLIYPSKTLVEQAVILSGLAINLAVMYAAIKFAPNEWVHAPLVMRNLPLIFLLGIIGSITGHVALAVEIGPGLAYSWGAAFCQLLLSIGGLCQLLTRGRTRGGSYTLWLSRFLGSCCTVGVAWVRCTYWPEAFSWLKSSLVLWCLAVFFFVDASYGVFFYYIQKLERTNGIDSTRKDV
ncbi:uncharacterized protein BDW43DRAFT_302821 [Aspergillus alliaceus]|uniref:uncharacterized protein n=1 Tax=Petromyces alliaceus TaxID=209559 RepID=UPI0012A757B9|nr:uncharacterized protein BDW43DRAFT_302821 [Aspergillus alliaceus]KAB8229866.1 hypothetical protein BDW43DRAFT_302821 [Aspergillus alliaceus]